MSAADAFRAIVERHRATTLRAAERVLGDPVEALDVTQEAFLALHERLDQVREPDIASWLTRVATNRALDRRRRARRERVERSVDDDVAPWSGATPATEADSRDQAARVRAALDGLAARQRQVVSMRLLEQKTFVEIARICAISEGAAKVHFTRGLQRLRDVLLPGERP